ncbi:MAG: hypothetical protein HYZ67_00725 [Chlamydiae bacterium]|nr:hypothetical protein [Chlamydiota bacterium]
MFQTEPERASASNGGVSAEVVEDYENRNIVLTIDTGNATNGEVYLDRRIYAPPTEEEISQISAAGGLVYNVAVRSGSVKEYYTEIELKTTEGEVVKLRYKIDSTVIAAGRVLLEIPEGYDIATLSSWVDVFLFDYNDSNNDGLPDNDSIGKGKTEIVFVGPHKVIAFDPASDDYLDYASTYFSEAVNSGYQNCTIGLTDYAVDSALGEAGWKVRALYSDSETFVAGSKDSYAIHYWKLDEGNGGVPLNILDEYGDVLVDTDGDGVGDSFLFKGMSSSYDNAGTLIQTLKRIWIGFQYVNAYGELESEAHPAVYVEKGNVKGWTVPFSAYTKVDFTKVTQAQVLFYGTDVTDELMTLINQAKEAGDDTLYSELTQAIGVDYAAWAQTGVTASGGSGARESESQSALPEINGPSLSGNVHPAESPAGGGGAGQISTVPESLLHLLDQLLGGGSPGEHGSANFGPNAISVTPPPTYFEGETGVAPVGDANLDTTPRSLSKDGNGSLKITFSSDDLSQEGDYLGFNVTPGFLDLTGLSEFNIWMGNASGIKSARLAFLDEEGHYWFGFLDGISQNVNSWTIPKSAVDSTSKGKLNGSKVAVFILVDKESLEEGLEGEDLNLDIQFGHKVESEAAAYEIYPPGCSQGGLFPRGRMTPLWGILVLMLPWVLRARVRRDGGGSGGGSGKVSFREDIRRALSELKQGRHLSSIPTPSRICEDLARRVISGMNPEGDVEENKNFQAEFLSVLALLDEETPFSQLSAAVDHLIQTRMDELKSAGKEPQESGLSDLKNDFLAQMIALRAAFESIPINIREMSTILEDYDLSNATVGEVMLLPSSFTLNPFASLMYGFIVKGDEILMTNLDFERQHQSVSFDARTQKAWASLRDRLVDSHRTYKDLYIGFIDYIDPNTWLPEILDALLNGDVQFSRGQGGKVFLELSPRPGFPDDGRGLRAEISFNGESGDHESRILVKITSLDHLYRKYYENHFPYQRHVLAMDHILSGLNVDASGNVQVTGDRSVLDGLIHDVGWDVKSIITVSSPEGADKKQVETNVRTALGIEGNKNIAIMVYGHETTAEQLQNMIERAARTLSGLKESFDPKKNLTLLFSDQNPLAEELHSLQNLVVWIATGDLTLKDLSIAFNRAGYEMDPELAQLIKDAEGEAELSRVLSGHIGPVPPHMSQWLDFKKRAQEEAGKQM